MFTIDTQTKLSVFGTGMFIIGIVFGALVWC